uniref:C2H2-type domain-containing protein n=1 Tax=Strongyloides venezuelensis TaxID=75913 RepID=A0A0K0F4X9_STRVS
MNQDIVKNKDGTIDWSEEGNVETVYSDNGKKLFYRKDLFFKKNKLKTRDINYFETILRNVEGMNDIENNVDVQLSCIGNVRKIFYNNNNGGCRLNSRKKLCDRILNDVSVYINLSDLINISRNYDQNYLEELQEIRSDSVTNVFTSNEYNQLHLAVNSRAEMLASIVNFDEILENLDNTEEGATSYRRRLIRVCNITLSGLERIIEDSEVYKRSTYAAFFGIFYKNDFFTNLTFDNNHFDNQVIQKEGLYQEGEIDIISLKLQAHFSFIINFKFTSNWKYSNKGSNIIRPFHNGILLNTTDCLILFTFSTTSSGVPDESWNGKENIISKYRKYHHWLISSDTSDRELKILNDGYEISSLKIKHLISYQKIRNNKNENIICQEKVVYIKNLLIDLIDVIYRKKNKSGKFYSLDDFQMDLINICEERDNIAFYITVLHRVLVNNNELTYNVIKFHAIFSLNLVLIKSTLLSCVKISNRQAQEGKFWYGRSSKMESYIKIPETHIYDNSEQLNGESKKFLIPFYQNITLAM